MSVTLAELQAARADLALSSVDEVELARVLEVAVKLTATELRDPFDIAEEPVREAIIFRAVDLWNRRNNPSGWELTENGGVSTSADRVIRMLLAPYKKIALR